jgi:signal transduction histidine kinase
MKKKYTFVNHFLPDSSNWSVIKHRKSYILIYTHIVLLFSLILLLVLSNTVAKVALLSSFFTVLAIIASLFYFKYKGNINKSGNILTTLWFITVLPIILFTGGINSSFMPWLYSVILVMVLVESYLWASVWFTIASLSCLGIFIAGRYYPALSVSICDDTDNFISFFVVGFFMFGSLIIFEMHQSFVIKILKEKTIELKNQKKAISEHAEELEKVKKQLIITNQELQTFAYAASHDLKEPLRMITMYTQLLEKKLKNVLDTNSTEFMFFITDGTKRMQKLLDNLLAYSLLGKNVVDVQELDLNEKVEKVLINLTVLIQESHATVNYSNLPHIIASETEITQLFQNLIANALKFRKKDVSPVINIACMDNPNEYLISISDNGIGIKTEDQERVFNIFTRLHNRTQFEGTGIGLATCKKILTNMKGKIWVTSTEGVGTTFYFTIPKTDYLETAPLANLVETA